MVDSIPNPNPLGAPGPEGGQPAGIDGLPGAGKTADRSAGTGGAEFQSLLERIETRARELAAETDAVEVPDQLAGAVDAARESLEDVLDLKERLLEAYRQQQQQAPKTDDGPV